MRQTAICPGAWVEEWLSAQTDEPMSFILCPGLDVFYFLYLLHYVLPLHLQCCCVLWHIGRRYVQSKPIDVFGAAQTVTYLFKCHSKLSPEGGFKEQLILDGLKIWLAAQVKFT